MKSQSELFELDKSIWTHDDYETMGWHDSNIYGCTIEKNRDTRTSDFVLDIDYIFKWVQPVLPSRTFTFWISPCTLIFKDCFDLRIDLRTDGGSLDLLEISDLILKGKTEQEENRFVYEWLIELQKGFITLKSYALEQVVRQKPRHVQEQVLTFDERGGISFERKPY
jgi:hypothetical protein